MSIINGVGRVGWKNYVATSPSYLLDTYTNAAVGYSLRKLSSAYTGSAIRVRRSSDNTEQNIGFDASGNLDTTSLLSFVGAGDGYVTTWYDQSGDISNNNPTWPGFTNKTMIQTTASRQPTIVSGGSLILRNGKPTVKYQPNSWLYTTGGDIRGTLMFDGADHSIFINYEKDSTANQVVLLGYNIGYLWLDYGSTQANGNNMISGTIPANSTKLITISHKWNGTKTMYMNNSVLGTTTGTSAVGCDMAYISSQYHTSGNFYINELIIYRSTQEANISNINTAINSYYSIYPTYPTSLKLFIDAGNPLSYSGTGATVTDLTGTQNGTLVNGTSYTSADGGSFVFDGINDYITFGTNAAIKPTTRGTISIMAKVINTTADWNGVVFSNNMFNNRKGVQIFAASKQNEYGNMVYYISSDSGTNGQYFTPTAPSYVNLWKLFTLTWDGTNIKTYLNGVLFNTRVQTLTVTQELTSPTVLGQSLGGYPPLKGNISYLKIYDVARTQAEITTDFNEIKSRYGL